MTQPTTNPHIHYNITTLRIHHIPSPTTSGPRTWSCLLLFSAFALCLCNLHSLSITFSTLSESPHFLSRHYHHHMHFPPTIQVVFPFTYLLSLLPPNSRATSLSFTLYLFSSFLYIHIEHIYISSSTFFSVLHATLLLAVISFHIHLLLSFPLHHTTIPNLF